MSLSIRKGLSFGLTSGVITTLGMIVGVNATTSSHLAVMAAIVAIAIADAFSDAVAMHVSEESEGVHSGQEIWEATMATFFAKFLFAMTFIVPVWLLPLNMAVLVDIVWGFLLISIFNILLARSRGDKIIRMTFEHLAVAIVVVFVTHVAGTLLSTVG
ncbi:MAG: hypothetical protein EAX95_01215 [Candidatus Thorarchaeota archaeon]|nr:hypothetical protein [Candidatus Thorarchaeota archaeon]